MDSWDNGRECSQTERIILLRIFSVKGNRNRSVDGEGIWEKRTGNKAVCLWVIELKEGVFVVAVVVVFLFSPYLYLSIFSKSL